MILGLNTAHNGHHEKKRMMACFECGVIGPVTLLQACKRHQNPKLDNYSLVANFGSLLKTDYGSCELDKILLDFFIDRSHT